MGSAKAREEEREPEVRGAEEEAEAKPGRGGRAAALPTRPPGARAPGWVRRGLTWSDCGAAAPAGGRSRGRPACGLLRCCLRCEGRNKNKTNHGTRPRPAAGGRGNRARARGSEGAGIGGRVQPTDSELGRGIR